MIRNHDPRRRFKYFQHSNSRRLSGLYGCQKDGPLTILIPCSYEHFATFSDPLLIQGRRVI